MKKYQISLDKTKKVMNVKVWGMFKPEDATEFVVDFQSASSTLETSEYVLSFDTKELSVSVQEMIPMLEGCFKMYKEMGFKKVLIDVGNNVTLKMQLNRVARSAGLVIEIL